MAELILVNEFDEQVGTADTRRCHSGRGILHRAFTIFLLNARGEILIQRRSDEKPLWPGIWETSCSGHPVAGEELVAAARERLGEELGVGTELEILGRFQYQAPYGEARSENEVCFVLAGRHDGEILPDPKEVSEYRWIEKAALRREIAVNPDEFAPWLIAGLEMVSDEDAAGT
jgi:isopentenyl-diphosphate delta-isomerase